MTLCVQRSSCSRKWTYSCGWPTDKREMKACQERSIKQHCNMIQAHQHAVHVHVQLHILKLYLQVLAQAEV